MRLHCLQHVPFEGPAAIAEWAATRGHALTTTRLWEDGALPAPAALDGVIAMGGPMSVHDEDAHPWLRSEKEFVRAAIAAGKMVVGVCLGAQLVAEALGAAVRPAAEKEIGWLPITPIAGAPLAALLPASLVVFHWHGETFDLPPAAAHLARSAACERQAFLYDGRVLGLQCHLEATVASVDALVRHCAHELVPGRFVQTAGAIRAASATHGPPAHAVLYALLDRLSAGRAAEGAR